MHYILTKCVIPPCCTGPQSSAAAAGHAPCPGTPRRRTAPMDRLSSRPRTCPALSSNANRNHHAETNIIEDYGTFARRQWGSDHTQPNNDAHHIMGIRLQGPEERVVVAKVDARSALDPVAAVVDGPVPPPRLGTIRPRRLQVQSEWRKEKTYNRSQGIASTTRNI